MFTLERVREIISISTRNAITIIRESVFNLSLYLNKESIISLSIYLERDFYVTLCRQRERERERERKREYISLYEKDYMNRENMFNLYLEKAIIISPFRDKQ